MRTINTIIDLIIKKEDISYNTDIFHLQSLGYNSDIKLYKECIIDNDYYDDVSENKIIENVYFRAKNIQNKLIFFINKWKWNKSVNYNIDTDLYLNKLDKFHKKYRITLLENNTRYQFRLSDLVNYWIESLHNCQGLFSKPLVLKNPHTNLLFSKHNLYNIYFKLLDTGFIIPTIITYFFYSNMDKDKLLYNYYHLLKQNTITTFINSNYTYDIWEQVLNMLHDFRKDIDYITFTNTISYRKKSNICMKLKPILRHYLNYKYSCNPLLSSDSKEKTKTELLKYIEDYPDFGYTRDNEVMRYVPYNERRRRPRATPPPPPNIFNQISTPQPPPLPIQTTQPLPPPPPPPPIIIPPVNPFAPSNQLPRTPSNNARRTRRNTNDNSRSLQMGGSLSLFRR